MRISRVEDSTVWVIHEIESHRPAALIETVVGVEEHLLHGGAKLLSVMGQLVLPCGRYRWI